MSYGQNFHEFARYERQMGYASWGIAGQEKLKTARVGLVGCGGLGAAVALHLVRAGVGFLRVIDDDRVSLSNLHRQILYVEKDVANRCYKTRVAAERLLEANSGAVVEPLVGRLTVDTVESFMHGLDLVVDGSDNFAARFLLNRAAVRFRMPWVYGGVGGASGMTMTIVPGEGPCLRCVLSEAENSTDPLRDYGSAVVNSVVTIIAALQSTEVYKLLIDPASRNRDLLAVDVWDMSFCKMMVERDPICPVCSGLPGAEVGTHEG
ncbi:MAG: HesA/MoeB/ThiF family protein [Actinobacteria bacterium]|nr:HesA/MoeB/ThiF family protein [Actinomycetota bacterium]